MIDCSSSFSTNLTINPNPDVDTGGPYEMCDGSAVDMLPIVDLGSGGDPALYDWQTDHPDAVFVPNNQVANPALLITQTGSTGSFTITVTVTNANTLCSTQAVTTLEVFELPVADAGGPYEGCSGLTLQMNGSGTAFMKYSSIASSLMDGAKGLNFSRILIFELIISRMSERRGSAKMLRFPSARAPHSIRP